MSANKLTFEQSQEVFSQSSTRPNSIWLYFQHVSRMHQSSCAITCRNTGILRYFICTSGNGDHRWFTAHADIAQCEHESRCVPWPQKCRFGFEISVATLYRSMRPTLFIPAFGIWPPSRFPVWMQSSTVHHRSPTGWPTVRWKPHEKKSPRR